MAWGRIHHVRLRNQTFGTSGVAPVEALFNREDDAVGGAGTTVKALGWDDRRATGSPTGRRCGCWSTWETPTSGRWVNQSGASGHPFGPYYGDQAELWLADRTWPMVLTRNAVAAARPHTLVLKPDG